MKKIVRFIKENPGLFLLTIILIIACIFIAIGTIKDGLGYFGLTLSLFPLVILAGIIMYHFDE
jgi:uncharacterized integral membrane protein